MRARHGFVLALLATAGLVVSCSSDSDDGSCAPDDADGITNVDKTVAVTIDDATFAPAIVKTQNRSNVTLILTNNGTKPHGFAVDCLATPNSRGCPTTSCFPETANTAPIAPGGIATLNFATPAVEGIYTYRSTGDGDTATGQFILQ